MGTYTIDENKAHGIVKYWKMNRHPWNHDITYSWKVSSYNEGKKHGLEMFRHDGDRQPFIFYTDDNKVAEASSLDELRSLLVDTQKFDTIKLFPAELKV